MIMRTVVLFAVMLTVVHAFGKHFGDILKKNGFSDVDIKEIEHGGEDVTHVLTECDDKDRYSESASAYGPVSAADICSEFECPINEELTPGCGYGRRHFAGAKWLGTVIDITRKDNGKAAYGRLLRYINGDNDKEMKISMGVPIITRWVLDEQSEVTEAIMYFYLPKKVANQGAPEPLNETVFVDAWPARVIDYTAFGDPPSQQILEEKASEVYQALLTAGKSFNPRKLMTILWEQPGKTWEQIQADCRRTEIVILSGNF